MITLKTEREVALMRQAGQVVARILREMTSMTEPGVTTGALNSLAEARCKELDVIPVFKGYHGFPASVCISVNEEVVHGIPSQKRVLKSGDIVGLDFGVSHSGWFGDSAVTIPVGAVSADAQKLMDVTRKSLDLAIQECVEGKKVSDIGFAVQNYVESFGFGVVREFVGHGIGTALHEDPQVPNFGVRGKGVSLKAGMVLAIEPMVTAGSPRVKVLSDGWTAVTADRSLAAHFEHTVAITKTGPVILTLE